MRTYRERDKLALEEPPPRSDLGRMWREILSGLPPKSWISVHGPFHHGPGIVSTYGAAIYTDTRYQTPELWDYWRGQGESPEQALADAENSWLHRHESGSTP